MRTTTLILAAAVVFAGIGSASACSYSGIDIAVDGDGDVELIDDGYGNQITGRVIGDYHSLHTEIYGSCNVIVTKQSGYFTSIGTIIEGNNQAVGVLLNNGATVELEMIGNNNQILIDANGGNYHTSIFGDGSSIYIKS